MTKKNQPSSQKAQYVCRPSPSLRFSASLAPGQSDPGWKVVKAHRRAVLRAVAAAGLFVLSAPSGYIDVCLQDDTAVPAG